MVKIIIRMLKSPWVRRLLVWLGPIVLGWLLERMGQKKSKKSVPSRRA